MTLRAVNILVRASKWKIRVFLVVEQRRFPFHRSVALGTARDVALGKLLAMNILVAIFALRRSSFEIHIKQLRFQVRRLVAVDARRCTVRTLQGELRLRVIETCQLLP